MHLRATEKPSTDGTTPIHRHRAAPTAATSNPSQEGSNQNHSAKNEAPTANEALVVSHCVSFDSTTGRAAMTFSLLPKYVPIANRQQLKAPPLPPIQLPK